MLDALGWGLMHIFSASRMWASFSGLSMESTGGQQPLAICRDTVWLDFELHRKGKYLFSGTGFFTQGNESSKIHSCYYVKLVHLELLNHVWTDPLEFISPISCWWTFG